MKFKYLRIRNLLFNVDSMYRVGENGQVDFQDGAAWVPSTQYKSEAALTAVGAFEISL